jgi:SAM-dependent methyltransferase
LKPFELAYLCAEPFLPPLHAAVRQRLLQMARASRNPAILDVGGRKSHYTIGVPASITVSDLERVSTQQDELNLGVTSQMISSTYARRSNIKRIVIDDMTNSTLPDCTFDCVVAVEVLEHVEQDRSFVAEVQRVLKPGGIFLLTTPNGDWIKVNNPDHKRHYRRAELRALLAAFFDQVEIEYAIRSGPLRRLGLRSWSALRPVRTAVSMLSNVGNRIQSSHPAIRHQSTGTHHLIAAATKAAHTG